MRRRLAGIGVFYRNLATFVMDNLALRVRVGLTYTVLKAENKA